MKQFIIDYDPIVITLCNSVNCKKLNLRCKDCPLSSYNRKLINEKKFNNGVKEFYSIIVKKGV